MAGDIKNVSRIRPCPICGKPDWCGFIPTNNFPGGELVLCMRDTQRSDVIGYDGNQYVFVSDKTGNSIFENASQRELRLKNWKASQAGNNTFVPKVKTFIYENKVERLPNEKLHVLYSDLMSMLTLEPVHEKYLLKEGWSKELIKKHKICSMPEDSYYRYKNRHFYFTKNLSREELAKALVLKHGDLTGMPGAKKNKKDEWTFAGLGGIVFPLYDANGNIICLRIRIDRQYADGEGNDISKEQYDSLKAQGLPCRDRGKYHNFSSYKQDPEKYELGIIANIHNYGCESGNHIGFYYDDDCDDFYVCYVTEGEKKCIIGNSILHVPFVDIPGVNSYNKLLEYDSHGKRPVDYLKEMGVRLIVMAFDADKIINSKVLDCLKKTIEIFLSEGFDVAEADWDMAQGKGHDDLLVAGYRPKYKFVK